MISICNRVLNEPTSIEAMTINWFNYLCNIVALDRSNETVILLSLEYYLIPILIYCYNLIIFYMSRLVERIKLGIVGQSGVGKTHFLHRFIFGEHSSRRIEATLAVEFY
jgi:hypothetical protein